MSFTPLERRSLQVAKRLLGKREATGRNDGWIARLTQRFIDPTLSWLAGSPWCVCFVIYSVHTAAAELGTRSQLPKTASSSALFRWFVRNKKRIYKPRPGCIGMVRNGNASGSDRASNRGKTHIHTFLVHDVQGHEVVGVDGNYRNRVAWSRRPITACDFGEIC